MPTPSTPDNRREIVQKHVRSTNATAEGMTEHFG